MGIKADTKYIGTVGHGSEIIETKKGTLGFQVMLDCEDGQTSHTIWLTSKNRVRAMVDFAILGVPADRLTDERYVQHQLSQDIVGKRVKFTTVEEEYNGKTKVKVAFIGRPGADGNAPKAVASFFAGDPAPEGTPITDDDIPF